jgi:hypothetical protein
MYRAWLYSGSVEPGREFGDRKIGVEVTMDNLIYRVIVVGALLAVVVGHRVIRKALDRQHGDLNSLDAPRNAQLRQGCRNL